MIACIDVLLLMYTFDGFTAGFLCIDGVFLAVLDGFTVFLDSSLLWSCSCRGDHWKTSMNHWNCGWCF